MDEVLRYYIENHRKVYMQIAEVSVEDLVPPTSKAADSQIFSSDKSCRFSAILTKAENLQLLENTKNYQAKQPLPGKAA